MSMFPMARFLHVVARGVRVVRLAGYGLGILSVLGLLWAAYAWSTPPQ